MAQEAAPRFFNLDGIAIHGTDPVAYFTMSKAVSGRLEFDAEHLGITFLFASINHRDMFAADPEKYAPQFGGYCAFAMSKGAVASSVPEAWNVVNGKLYLNYSLGVRDLWRKDIPGNISRANSFWPAALTKYGPPRS